MFSYQEARASVVELGGLATGTWWLSVACEQIASKFEDMFERCSLSKRAVSSALDDRAICDRIAKGNSQFDHACASINAGGCYIP